MISRYQKTPSTNDPPSLAASMAALEQELRATDLLVLNATVQSAQDGANSDDIFRMLQQIRSQTLGHIKRIVKIQGQSSKTGHST